MPGLLRAERGLGPRVAPDARRQGRRPLGAQRPEGVDVVRPGRALDDAARAHRPPGAQAQGDHLLPARHEAARRRREAAPADHGRSGVQRGLPRQRARPRIGGAGRRQQRLAGRDHDADVRAAHARLRSADAPPDRVRQPDRAGASDGEARARDHEGPAVAPEARPALDRHRVPPRHRRPGDHEALARRDAGRRGVHREDGLGRDSPASSGAGDGARGIVRAAREGLRVGRGGRRLAALLPPVTRQLIEGGTTEIQKNIIAERLLGLPKD